MPRLSQWPSGRGDQMIANILYNGPTFAKYRRENGENISQIENTSPDCKQVPQYHGVQVTILMHFRNPLRPELQYHRHKITAWANCWVSSGPDRQIEKPMAPTTTTWSTSIYLSWYFILSDKARVFLPILTLISAGNLGLVRPTAAWNIRFSENPVRRSERAMGRECMWVLCANYKPDYKSVKLFNIYSYLHKKSCLLERRTDIAQCRWEK